MWSYIPGLPLQGENSLVEIFSYLEMSCLWNTIDRVLVEKKLNAEHNNSLIYSYQVFLGFWLDFYALISLQKDDCVFHTHQALDFKALFGIFFIQSFLKYIFLLYYSQTKQELEMITWKHQIFPFLIISKSNKSSSWENR